MRKKLYFALCMATCLMFATACHKNNSAELTTSAYNDTISDMEKTTEATIDSSEESSENEKDAKTESSSKEETSSSTTSTKDSSDSSSNSSKEVSPTTSASSTEAKNTKTTEEEITAEGDENFEEPTTATKESEKETWASSGVLSGFNDGDSVEIIMADGSTKTFFVYDEKVAKQLEELLESGEEKSIDFISRPIAGQANSQIIEIK
ncbi:MAG: hypothetical protein ACI4F9_07115 [Lachnospiraceae bacterium]